MTVLTRPPRRSEDQRAEALARANEIRTWRAELKKGVKAGRVDVVGLLATGPVDGRLETMKIFDLLLAVPRFGRVKTDRALREMRISPSRSIAGLSDRQRAEIVGRLGAHAGRRRRTQPVDGAAAVRSGTPASGEET